MPALKKTLIAALIFSASLSPSLYAYERGYAPGQRDEKMQQHIDAHLEKLHEQLKLSPEQEGAWQSFKNAMTPKAHDAPPEREAWDKMTAPERMEEALNRLKEHAALMSARLAALKTFYATLTPEQQKILNEHTRHMRRED